jgi:hypothetical protein
MTDRTRRIALAALLTLTVAGAAGLARTTQAAPKEPLDTEKVGAVRNAPRPLPPPPSTAPAPVPKQPMADTAALLPGGPYTLAVTIRNETHEDAVKVTRNGAAVTLSVSGGGELTGTLLTDGRLQLQPAGGASAMQFSGNVARGRGQGQLQMTRGAQTIAGSFHLSPVTGARKPLQQYGAPTKGGGECGFFCRLGKAWDCLSNWSRC